MSSLTELTQQERLDLGLIEPIYLIEIDLGGGVLLRLAERSLQYLFGWQEIGFEGYIQSISGIEQSFDLRGSGTQNKSVRLTLANRPWGTLPYLSQLHRASPFTRGQVTVYAVNTVLDSDTVANKVKYSETFQAASWSTSVSTRLDNQIISPRGDLTGCLVTAAAMGSGSQCVQPLVGYPAIYSQQYVSIYAKKGNYPRLGFKGANRLGYDGTHFTYFNFDTETFVNADASCGVVGSSFERLPNGWYRLSIWGPGTGVSNANLVVMLTGTTGAGFVHNGTETYYLWGVHSDYRTYRATAYLPTLANQVQRILPMETFALDARSIVWKGVVESVSDIDRQQFTLTCSSRLWAARGGLELRKISRDVYPQADSNEVGKYRNLPVGDLEYVVCPNVKSGAIDMLKVALGKTESIVQVVGARTQEFPSGGGLIQIDNEQMSYELFKDGIFDGIERGVMGTRVSTHSANAAVFEIISDAVYEASQRPVKAFSQVRVDDFIQDASTYRAYTGRGDDQLSGYPGRAVIKFQLQPTIKKQFNVDVSVNDGSHTHDFSGQSTLDKHGASQSLLYGTFNNPTNIWDGNTGSWGQINYLPAAASAIQINLQAGGSGPISKIDLHITWKGWQSQAGHYVQVKFGNAILCTKYNSFGGGDLNNPTSITEVFTSTDTTAWDWSSPITIATSNWFGCDVWDVYVTYTYGGVSPAGDTAESSFNTIKQGVTVADLIVGTRVSADFEAAPDDEAGTYSGTPGGLIERPDHVFRYLLTEFGGIPQSDIGASFDASGALYDALGYKFAFLAHDLGSNLRTVLDSLAMQCRSLFFEWAGKFELVFLSESLPGAGDWTAEQQDIMGAPRWNYASLGLVKNRMNIFYRRDYRQGGSGQVLGMNSEAQSRGYMDMLESFYGPADLPGELLLNAVRLTEMARSVGGFWTNRLGQESEEVSLTLRWRGWKVSPGRFLQFSDDMMGNVIYQIIGFRANREAGSIELTGSAPFPEQGWSIGAWGWQPWGG